MLKQVKVWAAGIFTFCMLASSASAMWAAPPDEQWSTTADGKYDVLRNNKKSTITIYAAGRRNKIIWTATPSLFNSLFSKIKISPDGKTIVHIRSNQNVRKITDMAVESIKMDGTRKVFPASTFIAALELPNPRMPRMGSTPAASWLQSVTQVNNDSIELVNALGKTKTASWAEKKEKNKRRPRAKADGTH